MVLPDSVLNSFKKVIPQHERGHHKDWWSLLLFMLTVSPVDLKTFILFVKIQKCHWFSNFGCPIEYQENKWFTDSVEMSKQQILFYFLYLKNEFTKSKITFSTKISGHSSNVISCHMQQSPVQYSFIQHNLLFISPFSIFLHEGFPAF